MMRKILYTIVALIVVMAAMTFNACTIETSEAGDFEGMWHLTRVDTIATGGVLDKSNDKMYWSFQFKLMQATDKTGRRSNILMRYIAGDGTLKLHTPYIYNRGNGDKPLEDTNLLKPYGINNLEEEFQVLKLGGGKMQLKSDLLILTFRKF